MLSKIDIISILKNKSMIKVHTFIFFKQMYNKFINIKIKIHKRNSVKYTNKEKCL